MDDVAQPGDPGRGIWLLDSRLLFRLHIGSALLGILLLVAGGFLPNLFGPLSLCAFLCGTASMIAGLDLLFVWLIYDPFYRRGVVRRTFGCVDCCVASGVIVAALWLLSR